MEEDIAKLVKQKKDSLTGSDDDGEGIDVNDKDMFFTFFGRSTTLKTTAGVTPSMPVFHLGTSRLRSGASRSRLDVTRDDPRLAPGLGASLVSFGCDLDATKRGQDVPR